MKLDYRLALDLGTNSIGWCVYRVTPDDSSSDERMRWRITGVQRMGVRIFSDGRNPKDLASLAATRRLARQQRRRRDRALKRKARLIDRLIEAGLLPLNEAERKALVLLDPYQLRARALDQELPAHHVGRAIFHLARKRGFRSGRKEHASEDKEAGKIKTGIQNLRERLAQSGCRTVGEYLAHVHAQRQPVLARPDSAGDYPIYLARELVEDEFRKLWAAQALHRPEIYTDSARDRILDVVLFQRKLRPVAPGTCYFEPDQHRALLAHPMSQRFRILQELANLRLEYGRLDVRPLTRAQRDLLLSVLSTGSPDLDAQGRLLTWARLRKLIDAPKGCAINLDTAGRKGLKADMVSIALEDPRVVGPDWRQWSPVDQHRFLSAMRSADSVAELADTLAREGFRANAERVERVFAVASRMPDEFGSLSLRAMEKIVPQLEADVIHYDEAVRRAGYRSHSDRYDGVIEPQLPYYGERLPGYVQPRDIPGASPDERRFGRIANPTVHVGLNQLRRVVNAILRRYGNPREIIIEVARDLGLSGQRRRELEAEQLKNRRQNEQFADELARLGQRNNRENRQRLQLYRELERGDPLGIECIYTGERIGLTRLFSSEVEIDHILPFSRSLDDGIGNKLLCMRRANRDKRERTPWEAFSAPASGYDWTAILDRVERLLPRNKTRRFAESAMEDFLRGRDFLDRHLTDTAYFSRVAREYLTAVCPPNCVWVSTGKLTAMVRAKFGLNGILDGSGAKNRSDHRHHAIDAAVIGACDRRLIQVVATVAAKAEREGEARLLTEIGPPWPTFIDDIRNAVSRIIVSHKPEHGADGPLHNDTAYGQAEPADKDGRLLVTHRVSIFSLTSIADVKKLADDGPLRASLMKIFEMTPAKEIKNAIAQFSRETGVRRVKVTKRMKAQAISNPARREPKWVETQGNACYVITANDHGVWSGRAVSRFEAARNGGIGSDFEGRKVVMRLHLDDMVSAEREPGTRQVYRVVRLSDRQIVLAAHFEGGSLQQRHDDPNDAFRFWLLVPSSLRESKARTVGVDELGYVNDRGVS